MTKTKHIIAILLALGLLALVLLILDQAEKATQREIDKEETSSINQLKPVSVIDVAPTSSHAVVQSFGEVKARWNTTLKARMHGEVLSISKHIQVGKRVKAGEVLFTFDNHRYQTRLAEAKNQIAQAELLLQTEKEQAKLARSDWKLTRRKGNPSSFALRVPQIKAAQSQLDLAKASLSEINKTGSYAKIKAPYNGIVVSRSVNLGDVVEAGQPLAELISSDTLDITLKLDEQQWEMLGGQWQGQAVDIFAVNGIHPKDPKKQNPQWKAIIERDGGTVDSKSRQHILHLELSSADKPLAGTFVRVEITGKKLSNLLQIPQSSLTPQGRVWFVDTDNKLRRFKAKSLFSKGENIFVNAPLLSEPLLKDTSLKTSSLKDKKEKSNTYSIVVSPLSSYLPGLEVMPEKATSKAVLHEKIGD